MAYNVGFAVPCVWLITRLANRPKIEWETRQHNESAEFSNA